MTFPDVVVSENPSNEEGECDLNEEIVRLFKTAKLKCKFEIQKIEEVLLCYHQLNLLYYKD